MKNLHSCRVMFLGCSFCAFFFSFRELQKRVCVLLQPIPIVAAVKAIPQHFRDRYFEKPPRCSWGRCFLRSMKFYSYDKCWKLHVLQRFNVCLFLVYNEAIRATRDCCFVCLFVCLWLLHGKVWIAPSLDCKEHTFVQLNP